MKYILDIIYFLALIIISPKIIYRIIKQNRYRAGWSQRLGKVERKYPEKKCIWIHAVSVGEVNATKTIIAQLQKRLSEYEIIISATTDTGFQRAIKLYSEKFYVFYYPFDFSFIIRRAFKRLRPDICLLIELELWPNFADCAKKLNTPVVIVNGRISDKSFPRYKLLKPFVKPIFQKVALFLAQSSEYAEKFIAIGGQKQAAVITGSLKYDTAQTTDNIAGTEVLKEQLNINNNRLFVAGGTGPSEEKIILETFKTLKADENFADVLLAIVPRKPERFNEVAELITQSGFDIVRYSKIKSGQQKEIPASQPVILGDTMGDLRKFYAISSLVFVGRSLVPMGGSDMMESTAMGKCTIFGPHTFNFKQTVDALLSGNGAIEVKNQDQLLKTITKCLLDSDYANKIAAAGQKIIIENQGATEKTVNAIVSLLS